jgi:hypothetical protein
MIRLGLTLRSNCDPRHIWVVLNNPDQGNGEILFVNFTSLVAERDEDEEVFDETDYCLLSQQSVVAFWGTRNGAASKKLKIAIDQGYFTILPDLPDQTLRKIIVAAERSQHLSITQKRLLAN